MMLQGTDALLAWADVVVTNYTLGVPDRLGFGFERLQQIIRRITELGFDAFRSVFEYFLLGAVIVIPIWFLMRLFGRSRDPKP